MDSKENATSCPICQETYTDPRSLACGHSFCLQCLKGVAGNKQTFPCPICRFDVDLRYTNVDQLPKNYVLCIVIEALDKNTRSMCSDHNKSLDLFCQLCDEVICSKCLTIQHKGHDFEHIEQIYTERNKQLVAFLESTNHLTSMTKAKSDAVKQSRILMEKNIDSVSKTVENTFKKWNDALQKQHHSIASYVYQERDQKRKVCLDAEGILAGLMNTLTGLETDINRLRSKDIVVVVQQFGSIKTRQEDTERKVLQDIETCFTPPDNLVIEIYAPWIEEAINNIKHIDMKQTQARLVPQTIAAIQEENAILKRQLLGFKKDTERKTTYYEQRLAKEVKSKEDIDANLKRTKQDLNEKIQTLKALQAKHETLQRDHTNAVNQLREINMETSILEDTYIKMQQKMVDMDDKYQRMIEQKNHEITRLRQSEENLLTRLNKLAEDRFTHDNVIIAYLSDDDRPTKLSETYSELFDNEWTDAFEELTEDMKLSDEAAIRLLLKILMNAFRKCKEMTWDRYESLKLVASTIDVMQDKLPSMITEEKQNPTANKSEVVTDGQQEEENEEADTNISENPITNKSEVVTDGQQEEENEEADTNISEPPTANLSDGTTSGQQEEETEPAGTNTSELCMQSTSRTLTLSSDQEKSLKHMWRSTTINIKDESLKLLCANLLTCLGKPETEMPKTAKYLRCCTELCWKMGVQEKPMHLNVNAEKQAGQEKRFDTDKFRAYTRTGKYVDYVVWPALLLHEGGAMLAKGIAQGCQERVSSKE